MGDRGMCGGAAGSGERVGGGGPVSPVLGGSGVSTWTGRVNFVAVSAGRDTIIQRVVRNGGVVERTPADRRPLRHPRRRLRRLDHRALRRRPDARPRRAHAVHDQDPPARAGHARPCARASASRCPSSSPSTRSRPTAARSTCCAIRRRGRRYDVMALDLRTGRLRGEPDHGSARARRADGRHPAHPDDEPRHALGLHALQRRAELRPRARHEGGHGPLHRPPGRRSLRRATRARRPDAAGRRRGDDRPAHVRRGQAPARPVATRARRRRPRRPRTTAASPGCRWRSGSSRWRSRGCSPAASARPAGARSRCGVRSRARGSRRASNPSLNPEQKPTFGEAASGRSAARPRSNARRRCPCTVDP